MFKYLSRLTDTFKEEAKRPSVIEDAEDLTATQSGLLSTTMVATMQGWQQVGDLGPGDKVLTFDAGLQTITKAIREPLWQEGAPCPKSLWPVEIPPGAMGNRRTIHLMPNQSIMVESDEAEKRYGDPFTLIPSGALVGIKGVERVPPSSDLDVIHLFFSSDQVVFGENGTLYLCPASRDMIDILLQGESDPMYSILPVREARLVAKTLGDKGGAIGTGHLPEELLNGVYA